MRRWTEPSWRRAALAWADAELARLGRRVTREPEQFHVRPWSTSFRIGTRGTDAFRAIVGAGAISRPYAQRGATMPVFRWKASARRDAEHVITDLWPFLGETKRAQAQRLLDTLAAQPDLPRDNPAWGSHKTHCVNGHEYATARVRRYVPRGKGLPRRGNQSCLACLREYARRGRETKGSAADDDRRSLSEPELRYLLK